jgi:hypothetical protein
MRDVGRFDRDVPDHAKAGTLPEHEQALRK